LHYGQSFAGFLAAFSFGFGISLDFYIYHLHAKGGRIARIRGSQVVYAIILPKTHIYQLAQGSRGMGSTQQIVVKAGYM